jgi:hypothetical protein
LRPLGKVVGITHTILKNQNHKGIMKRVRVGPKEKNIWKQIVEPCGDDAHALPTRFMVNDKNLKDTKTVNII